MRMYKRKLLAIPVLVASFSGCDASPQRYLDKGNGLFDAGRYAEADLNYQKAIQKDSTFGEAYYRLGLSEFKEKKLADSDAALTHASELLPARDDVKAALADTAFAGYLVNRRDAHYYGQVQSISRLLLEKNPSSYDGLRLKGYIAMVDLHLPEAIQILRQANAVKPMQSETIEALTQCLIGNGQFPEAEKLANDLIQKDPSDGRIYDILYEYYMTNKRPADGEAILRKKMEKNPNNLAYRLQLAHYFAASNNREAMSQTIEEASNNPSRFQNVFAEVGAFYASLGLYDDALRAYETGMKTDDRDQKWNCERGKVELMVTQKKWDQAREVTQQMLKESPGNAEARALRVEIDLDEGQPEKAAATIAELRQLIKLDDRNPQLHYNLGRAYVAANNTESALAQFNQAINLSPGFVPAIVYAANVSLNRQEFKEANQYATRLVSLTNGDASARLLNAASLIGMGNYNDASRELNQLTREYPNAPMPKIQEGELLRAQKNYKEAENIFRSIYESDRTDVVALGNLMNTYYDQGKYDAAIQYLTQESRRTGSAQIQQMLADAALRGKKLDVAIQQYSQMAGAQPQNAMAHLKLGDAYLQAGRMDDAVNQFETARKLAPKDALVTAMLALGFHDSGRTADAEKAYRDTLALQSDNPEVKNNLAYLMADTGGNLDDALRLAQEASRAQPQDTAFSDTVGWIYFKKKDTDSAIHVLTNIVQKDPTRPEYHYHLAAALLEKGDRAEARRQLQAALENRPSKAYEAKIRDLMGKVSSN